MAVALLFILGLGMINGFISDRVTDPINRLEIALKEIEGGNFDTVIREKGCYELRHLSRSVKQMAVELHRLMEQAEREHEIQRKNELNTLQSQIIRLLYNTLDIVIWMVQNEKKEDAVQALTALARFFRIGLSGGRTIISVGEELEHVKSYLTIQMMRHKNKFQYHFEIQEEVEKLATLKLILQPLVENAIAYGVQYQDGDGEIWIRAYQEEGSLILQVEDNGLGIPPDRLEDLRRGKISPSGKGSGIGVRNVNERIALYFGEDYGLAIDTELDEGTVVTLTQPAVDEEDYQWRGVGSGKLSCWDWQWWAFCFCSPPQICFLRRREEIYTISVIQDENDSRYQDRPGRESIRLPAQRTRTFITRTASVSDADGS